VLTHDVGGGFGMKAQAYPEYGAILYAARKCGRPVKWCNSRMESFLSDSAGRDGILEGELALDAKGKFLGLRMRNLVGIGAYTTQYAAIFATHEHEELPVQRLSHSGDRIDVKMVLTNAAPLGPIAAPDARGDLPDRAADRRRGARDEHRPRVAAAAQSHPAKAMPYKTPNGPIYDCGEFEAAMDKALALADWKGLPSAARLAPERQAARHRDVLLPRSRGRHPEREGRSALRGRQGRDPARRAGDGTGASLDLAAHRLQNARCRPPARVKLIEGDSDEVPDGTAVGRQIALADDGRQRVENCLRPRESTKGRRLASQIFEVATADIEFVGGVYSVAGTDLKCSSSRWRQRERTLGDTARRPQSRSRHGRRFISPQVVPERCQ
jgi:carbon-monoxide dehydrogenase large subunit